jgi:hypothetical protein
MAGRHTLGYKRGVWHHHAGSEVGIQSSQQSEEEEEEKVRTKVLSTTDIHEET